MSGILSIVGTPIGNLSDFSPRGIDTLKVCDFIAAEDTRVTRKLLSAFDIQKPMISYFEHNKHERENVIIQRILNGENCALVTDAGMPAISDPGQELVNACYEHGILVQAVPGPTAFATAIALSGLPSDRFTFEGFLSVQKNNRKAHLAELVSEKRTMVLYEAPHKLAATLADLFDALGNRKIAIVREITKIYEEVIRTTLTEAAQLYKEKTLKGEIVLIIEGATLLEGKWTLMQAVEVGKKYMQEGKSINEAAKLASSASHIRKSDIYKELLR